MSDSLLPTDAQLATFSALPMDAPLAVLNLFRFRARADYQPGDPEYGTPEADVSGRDAFARYQAIAGDALQAGGGHTDFAVPVDQVMIGSEDQHWDVAAIMRFPSRAAFAALLGSEDFQQASRHRKAALARHLMLHLDGRAIGGGGTGRAGF